jgi:hypothetical protein
MSRRFWSLAFTTLVLTALPLTAFADGDENVSVVRAQFTNKVEASKPTGDGGTIASGQVATYWLEVSNPKDATQITLVWKLDGAEQGKQTLDIGHAPHWRTWGSWPTKKAHTIEVQVLDKDGHELKTESLTPASS